jgi:tripartite-type tricarboxylate transporter receptor subunit TctC
VPYRGGAAAMSDLMGGNVDTSFQNLGAAIRHIRSGRLKALGRHQRPSAAQPAARRHPR